MTGIAAPIETANFGFLAKHDVQLMSLSEQRDAELAFFDHGI
jgi:hypothetical protein